MRVVPAITLLWFSRNSLSIDIAMVGGGGELVLDECGGGFGSDADV